MVTMNTNSARITLIPGMRVSSLNWTVEMMKSTSAADHTTEAKNPTRSGNRVRVRGNCFFGRIGAFTNMIIDGSHSRRNWDTTYVHTTPHITPEWFSLRIFPVGGDGCV